MAISDELRKATDAALEAGLSRNALAIQAGLPYPVLSRWLNGERGMGMESIDRLAEYLNLTLVSKSEASKGPKRSAKKSREKTGRGNKAD